MTWETSSGGLDNFHFTVERAYFGTNANYNNGNTLLLNLEGKTDLDTSIESRDSFNVSFPCGNGWLTDDGQTAYHEAGDLATQKGFNKNSWVGRLITSALNDLGIGEVLKSRGSSLDASVWVGFTFLMKRQEVNFGGDLGSKERLMPAQVVSLDGKPFGSAASAAATAGTEVQQAAAGVSKVLEAKVKAIAKKVKAAGGQPQDFIDEATGIDGVASDSDLLDAIVDVDSGIWASVDA